MILRPFLDLQRAVGRTFLDLADRLLTVSDPGEDTGSRRETPWTDEDRLLEDVEEYLARGRDLLRWWQEASRDRSFARRFPLGRSARESSDSYGFFDRVRVGGRDMRVMGNFQQMFFDRPKPVPGGERRSAPWIRDQVREFALRYFMRVSDFEEPKGFVAKGGGATPPLLRPLSLCPDEEDSRRGFGFEQLYFKRRNGEVGKFPAGERSAIVDLRRLWTEYEWIVVRVQIFDFSFAARPFGPGGPELSLPLEEASYLVLSRELVCDEERPEPGILGRYGIGYAFIKNPEPGVLGYGPGEFEAAIELIDFEVLEDGEVQVPMVFVADRPERVVNLPLDPMAWGLRLANAMSLGMLARLLPLEEALRRSPLRLEVDPVYGYVDLANLLTAGLAGQLLCISREQLQKEFLVKHFMQHYQTVAGALATWRVVEDWLDESDLPDWVVSGELP